MHDFKMVLLIIEYGKKNLYKCITDYKKKAHVK